MPLARLRTRRTRGCVCAASASNGSSVLSHRLDVTSTGSDPRVFLYQGESWVEDDDDGGEGTNARIVRFLTPGTYSVRVVELRARTMAARFPSAKAPSNT